MTETTETIRLWIARLKHEDTPVRLRYMGLVLGVVGPWQIHDPGGPRHGKFVRSENITEMWREQ